MSPHENSHTIKTIREEPSSQQYQQSRCRIDFLGVAPAADAQGLVKLQKHSRNPDFFSNYNGQISTINGPAGSYYFGLLIAHPGTTDPKAFVFTGVYATNLAPQEGLVAG